MGKKKDNAVLSPGEQRLVSHLKRAVVSQNRMRHARGGMDTLYACVLSESGKVYDGACFESSMSQATVCGERDAIANMVRAEGYGARIASIAVADPVPEVQEKSSTPCGLCRHVIGEYATAKTTVLCLQYVQHRKGSGKKDKGLSWTFHGVQKYNARALYPHPYAPKPGLWDDWVPGE